jgi:hypothetical protein
MLREIQLAVMLAAMYLWTEFYGNENWKKRQIRMIPKSRFETSICKVKTISQISSNYLQTRSWILMPGKVNYYVSADNVTFTVGTVLVSGDQKCKQ